MGIYNPFVQLFPITWFMYSKLKYSCNELQFTAPFFENELNLYEKNQGRAFILFKNIGR